MFDTSTARRKLAGIGAGAVLGATTVALLAAPTAMADPADCSTDAVNGTVNSVTTDAQQYLAGHPGAKNVLTAAYTQPREQAASDIRNYFTANPGEYFELRGILAPIGEKQRQCNVSALSPQLASAYNEFMAG